ncbi:MAG: hypothetical protein GQ527_02595, partial [Bacteroidales bacterium]|nr:hypothetical protein [Bacteroidales bacterium]
DTTDIIFDSFFRAKGTTNIEGTGMGLSILKKSTELLGGKIKVESKKGEGSKFIVELPLE